MSLTAEDIITDVTASVWEDDVTDQEITVGRYLSETDLKVFAIDDDNTVTELTYGVSEDFTATDPDTLVYAVTIRKEADIPATTARFVVLNYPDSSAAAFGGFAQSTEYPENAVFPAASHERALDKLTLIAQFLDWARQWSLRYPQSEAVASLSGGSGELPIASERANKYLVFDEDGDPQTTTSLGTWQGDFQAGVSYVERDYIRDTSNGNIYLVTAAIATSTAIATHVTAEEMVLLADLSVYSDMVARSGDFAGDGSTFVLTSTEVPELAFGSTFAATPVVTISWSVSGSPHYVVIPQISAVSTTAVEITLSAPVPAGRTLTLHYRASEESS
jgi:hypothetical protein